MPWGRMDDKWHRDRSVAQLRRSGPKGLEALGLWGFFCSWCLNDPALDGLVPRAELTKHEQSVALRLVDAGLWRASADGFQVVGWEEIAPPREQLERKREADRTRIAEKRADERQASLKLVARDSRTPNARDPDPVPIPTQPDPTPGLFPRACAGLGQEQLEGNRDPQPFVEPLEEGGLILVGARPSAAAPGLEPLATACRAVEAEKGAERAAAAAAWQGVDLGGQDWGACPIEDDLVPGELATDHAANTNAGRDVLARMVTAEDRFTYERQVRTRFQSLYEQAFSDCPSMGGKNVEVFPERLRKTAQLRELDPFDLLDRAFAVFASEPLDDIGRRAPFATFAARFSGYLSKPQAQALAPQQALRARMAAALKQSDRAQYDALDLEYRTTYLGGRDARPA